MLTLFYTLGGMAQNMSGKHTKCGPVFHKDILSFILICFTKVLIGRKIVNSACGINAFCMCFNGTDIWGDETTVFYPIEIHIKCLNSTGRFYFFLPSTPSSAAYHNAAWTVFFSDMGLLPIQILMWVP